MDGEAVVLPGGLPVGAGIERRATFRPLTGDVERAFLDSLAAMASPDRPRAVSDMLGAALARIGDVPADRAVAARLCVADRNYLLLRLAQILAGDALWIRPQCCRCHVPFDVRVSRSEIPIKPAGPGFPFAELQLRGTELVARVPTGEDQEAIMGLEDDAALRTLLARCLSRAGGAPLPDGVATDLTDDEIRAVEDRVDAVAPDVGTRLTTACPECGAHQVVDLDPFAFDGDAWGVDALYDDVHVLALYYHWSECDILALPRARRRFYLELIDRSRGVFA